MENFVESFNRLLEMQKVLDAAILEEKNLELHTTYWRRIVALITEMGEVANEVRFFKFWSNKGPSEREVILEEFVDVLHFLLSALYIKGHYNVEDLHIEQMGTEVVETWLGLVACCLDEMDMVNAGRVVSHYLHLAKLWGFDWNDIVAAYEAKNKVNFERLASGY